MHPKRQILLKVHIFMKKYAPEFQISVIMDMRENHMCYRETMKKYLPELEQNLFGFYASS